MIYILDFIMVDCLVEHHLSQVLIVLYSVQHYFCTYHDARCVIFLMKYCSISLACVQKFTKYTPYLSISNHLCVGCSEKSWEMMYNIFLWSPYFSLNMYTIYGLYFEKF